MDGVNTGHVPRTWRGVNNLDWVVDWFVWVGLGVELINFAKEGRNIFSGTPLLERVPSPALAQWKGVGRAVRAAPGGNASVPAPEEDGIPSLHQQAF